VELFVNREFDKYKIAVEIAKVGGIHSDETIEILKSKL